jgi:hypothetical protein
MVSIFRLQSLYLFTNLPRKSIKILALDFIWTLKLPVVPPITNTPAQPELGNTSSIFALLQETRFFAATGTAATLCTL